MTATRRLVFIISETLSIACMLAVIATLALAATFYIPRNAVPSSVSIRCDQLCPSNSTVKSQKLAPFSAFLGTSLMNGKYPVIPLAFIGCFLLAPLLFHTVFLILNYRDDYSALPKKASVQDIINRLLAIAIYVAIASSIPYFTLPDPFIVISFVAVLAFMANICDSPFLTRLAVSETRSFWYFKTAKFILCFAIGALLTYVSIEMLAMLIGRQKDDLAEMCIDDNCDPELYDQFCRSSPLSYATVECTKPQSHWMPSVNVFPDRIATVVAFIWSTLLPLLEMFINRYATAGGIGVSYVVSFSLGYIASVGVVDLNGGYLIGTLIGWLTTNIAMSQLGSTFVTTPYFDESRQQRQPVTNDPAFPSLPPPPTYEMAMARGNQVMSSSVVVDPASVAIATPLANPGTPPDKAVTSGVQPTASGVSAAETHT